MRTITIIVAGGSGTRFGAQLPKQFLELAAKPILMRTINAFGENRDGSFDVIVTLPAGQMDLWRALCEQYGFAVPHRIVAGGETRWHSVKNALNSIGDIADVDVIAVHDGVRPLAPPSLINRVLEAARRDGAAIPVVMLNDSVRQVVGAMSHALDRSSLRAVQTPQAFDARLLIEAYRQPFDPTFTDDASVVERYGHQVTLVEGDPQNLKITRPMDLALAEYLLNLMPDLRHTDIQYLHGVGPKRAELLKKELGISTYYDLLYYFPFRYIDRSVINHVNDMHGDEAAVQLKGRFLTFNTAGEGRKRRLQALFSDGTGTIEVVWFNRVASIQKTYNTNTQYVLFGKPSMFNNHMNIVHPEVDIATSETISQGLTGVYNLTEVLRNRSFTSRAIHKLVLNVLNTPAVQHIDETLPPEIMQRYHLMPLCEALRNIHLPTDHHALQRAQFRLKFEELFFLELNILHYIKGSSRRLTGHVFSRVGAYFHDFYNNVLQFPLTGAQKRVIREMRHDMGSGKQMNRLLAGRRGQRQDDRRLHDRPHRARQRLPGVYHGAYRDPRGAASGDHQAAGRCHRREGGALDRIDAQA